MSPIHYGADLPHRATANASVVIASAAALAAGPLSLALAVPYVVILCVALWAAFMLYVVAVAFD